ncbi:MAG: hypothetical protein WKF84_28980 [Pyrinomonadaceae bacterium]
MQREHCSERLTEMLVVRPLTDSSKLRASGISMSAPRLGIGRGGSGSASSRRAGAATEKIGEDIAKA